MITLAPLDAHAKAMPRPTPPPAPVTMTVRSSSNFRPSAPIGAGAHSAIQTPPSATGSRR